MVACNYCSPGYKWSVVPEKAKEDLVHLITVLMPQEKAVCMIFSWACRHFLDPCSETQEVSCVELFPVGFECFEFVSDI